MTQSIRYDYLDLAKGIAIILVVAGHVIQFNFVGANGKICFDFIYSFHMPMFMFLSGVAATFGRSRVNMATAFGFIKKKFITLVLPFLVWGLVVQPFAIGNTKLENLPILLLDLLKNPQKGAWFLIVLFCIQLFFLVSCLLANRFYKRLGLYSDVISIIITIVVLAVINRMIGGSPYISLTYIVPFFVGYLSNEWGKYLFQGGDCLRTPFSLSFYHLEACERPISTRSVFTNFRLIPNDNTKGKQKTVLGQAGGGLFIVIILAFFIVLTRHYSFNVSSNIHKMFTGIFSSFLLMHIVVAWNGNKRMVLGQRFYNSIIFIGCHTIEIYLTHFLIVMALKKVMIDSYFINPIPLFFAVFVASYLISLLVISLSQFVSAVPIFGLLLYGRRYKNKNVRKENAF